ncbi:MAG: asparagine synthase (glutamine-hydrolyzing) [Solirubrobacterales bacterium]|nr:asparagine synthase (glutamine-hydrolyzing) [Solirubrobacterales bacterium]
MCGIAGVFEFAGTGEVDPAVLVAMRDTMIHRGPDGEGLFMSGDRKLGLAHRRLSIVDLDGGHQPMAGAGGLMLVFNGEIYNFPRLKASLESEGVRFETSCDTEVILKLYEKHGRDCVEHLDGMFAFALWDPSRQEVFFARDRVGEKPFYWSSEGGRFLFGSEIKAILQHPAITPEVNEAAVGPYLTNLVTTAPETLYRGIFKLQPGFAGYCGRGGVTTYAYGPVFGGRKAGTSSFGDASKNVKDLLERSVSDRLMADVPVGVLLSGGLDSSTIVGLLRDKAPGIATFSVGFEGRVDIDERSEARRAAKHFGTDHHEVEVSGEEARAFLAGLVHHQDEPLADPVCMPLNFVCELAAKQGVKVVMAGEGADELFWGYPGYSKILDRERELRALLAAPGSISKIGAGVGSLMRSPRLVELMDGIASGRPLPLHMPLGMTRRQRASLLGAAQPAYSGWSPPAGGESKGGDPIETLFWDTQEYEFGLRLPELLLMRIDRFSMANSVEARVPFLAPELVDYAYPLPLDFKWKQGVTKRVLRESLGDVVPSWILERPKRGFGAPVDEWFSGDLLASFERLIDTDSVRRFFQPDAVRRMLYSKGRGSTQARWSLWSVFNFALWHRYWIEGLPIEEIVPVTAGTASR